MLSLPWSLRYLLAFDAALGRDVLAVFIRAVFGWLRRRAAGDGVAGGQCGAVTPRRSRESDRLCFDRVTHPSSSGEVLAVAGPVEGVDIKRPMPTPSTGLRSPT